MCVVTSAGAFRAAWTLHVPGTASLMWKVSRIAVGSGRVPGCTDRAVFPHLGSFSRRGKAKTGHSLWLVFLVSVVCYYNWPIIISPILSFLVGGETAGQHSKPKRKTSLERIFEVSNSTQAKKDTLPRMENQNPQLKSYSQTLTRVKKATVLQQGIHILPT